MTNPIDRIVIALDAVDGMPFGKVGKALDGIAEDAQATKRTIEALVGALEEAQHLLQGPVSGDVDFIIERDARLQVIDRALRLARGGA